MTSTRGNGARAATSACLISLIVLALAWELVLAPLRPGGSWLALKVVPLLFAVRGVWRGEIYTYRWSLMLVLAYFGEGCVRAYSDRAPSSTYALIEIALSVAFSLCAMAYVRAQGRA